MSDRPPDRPPPVYSADPDDPFQSVQPNDPNLSFTAPPNPANMRLPEGASPHSTWHVLTGALAVGMSNSWPITRILTDGISGQAHVSYPSWDAALRAYTIAFNANAVEVLRERTRRAVRRGLTPQPTPQASQGGSAHRSSTQNTPSALPGGSYSNPYFVTSSPFPSGHPQHPFYIGSSPAPASPAPASPAPASPAPASPAPNYQSATPSRTAGSNSRLNLIEEALLEANPRTPPPADDNLAVLRDAARSRRRAIQDARSRLRVIEDALNEYDARQGAVSSPQTPTPANSTVEARLSALEAAMHLILAREAMREPEPRGDGIQDGRDPESHLFDGRDPTPPRSAPPATPVAGSSTGPGTLAGLGARSDAPPSVLRSPIALNALCQCEDDDSDEYNFDEFTPEESAELDQLLNAIHENYNANKKK